MFNRKQENNSIVNIVVDEILLHETQKESAAREALEVLDSNYDDNNLYHLERMGIEET